MHLDEIDLNHLESWFSKIYVVNDKKSADLSQIVLDSFVGPEHTYKIGNSVRSDINPALEAGIKAIYIPCETWAYEREHNGIDHDNPRIHEFKNLREIIAKYHLLWDKNVCQ